MSKQQENQNPSSKDVDNGIFDEQYIKMFEVKLPENIKGVIINFQIIVDEIFKADINERRLQKVKKRLEFSKIENRIIAISPIFIALVDFFLAGIVFSQLSKAVPIPRFDNNFDDLIDFLIIALIAVMIVWLELFMGLLSHKKDTNNSSNYLTILSKIFVFIIPIIAFSEGFKELALLPQKFKASDTPYSENSLNAGYLAICLKYFGLALMSFITHSFLVFKAIPIVENFSLFWYEKYLIGNTDLDKNNPLDKQIFDLRRKILVYYYRLQLYEDWVTYELTKDTNEEVNENLEDNFDDEIDESQEIEDKSSQKRNEFVFKSIKNLKDKLSTRIDTIIQDYQNTDTLKT